MLEKFRPIRRLLPGGLLRSPSTGGFAKCPNANRVQVRASWSSARPGGTGKLAVETAKLLGADATIRLDQPEQDLTEAFARAAGDAGFNVIIDYLWGRPTEALLAAITRADLRHSSTRTRLVQVGESAGRLNQVRRVTRPAGGAP